MDKERPFKERTFTVSTRLDPKTLRQFEKIAKQQHRSLSALLRISLEDQLIILLNGGKEERHTHETIHETP